MKNEESRTNEKSWISVGTPRAVNYPVAYSFEIEFNISGPTLRSEVKNYADARARVYVYAKSS